MEEDGVGAGVVELAPCLVGDVVRGQDAAPVEEERVRGYEGLVFAGGV